MLESSLLSRYLITVTEPSVARRGNRILGAQAPSQGAFFVRCHPMAGDAGQAARSGRVPSSRFSTPASFAALAVESMVGGLQPTGSLS